MQLSLIPYSMELEKPGGPLKNNTNSVMAHYFSIQF